MYSCLYNKLPRYAEWIAAEALERQRLNAVGVVLQTVDFGLEVLERVHLDHILKTRAEDHHFNSLELGRLAGRGDARFARLCRVPNED